MVVLAGVDRAAFVAALAMRLRRTGVPVTLGGMAALSDALEAAPPDRVERLYWLARLTLVTRHGDLAPFDRVFDAVFRDAVLAVDPHARRTGSGEATAEGDTLRAVPGGEGGGLSSGDLPWRTLPVTVDTDDGEPEGEALPELLPSALARVADVPFDRLDEDQLALLGRWLEEAAPRWPVRRGRRMAVGPTGGRVALRATLAAARRTGWEPFELRRTHPVPRPMTVTLLCDVSRSMQGYATAYLHLMRAFARTRRAETFAFATSLTRLTPALAHRSAAEAVALAEQQVVDRFGGTHLASSLVELLASRHRDVLRGGVLVIASDGWDSDEPEALAAVLARVRRRSRRVVWLNPRASQPGYEPLVGSMAAALPFCDSFLPGDTLRNLPAVLDAIAGVSSRG